MLAPGEILADAIKSYGVAIPWLTKAKMKTSRSIRERLSLFVLEFLGTGREYKRLVQSSPACVLPLQRLNYFCKCPIANVPIWFNLDQPPKEPDFQPFDQSKYFFRLIR
jgi:hypothetical protein